MIQFNLLPQVKVDYIKTRRLKHALIVIAIAVTIASVAIAILTFSFSAVKAKHLENLDKDIAKISKEIETIPDLKKMLSVQNQLNTLPALYNGRPAVKRLPVFLDQTTPTGTINLSSVSLDFSTSTITFMGTGPSLEDVNRYVDTLKFTTYKVGEEETKTAFSNVVLTSFGRDDKAASFTIALNFDPVIFDGAQDVALVIPSIVTTRSQVEVPASLFNGAPSTQGQEE